MSFPDVTFDDVKTLIPELEGVAPEIAEQMSRDALYANYLDRQERDIGLLKRDEALRIPDGFDFDGLSGLSNEMKVKLNAARPATIAQMARIDGITPAALTLVLAHLRRLQRSKSA